MKINFRLLKCSVKSRSGLPLLRREEGVPRTHRKTALFANRPAGDDFQASLAAVQAELELERAKNSALQLATAELRARLREPQPGIAPARLDTPAVVNPDPPKPDDPLSELELGRSLIATGRIDEAVLVLSRVAQAAPESTEALTLLGRVFLAKGLPDAAEAVLHRALRIDANCGDAHLEMARLCINRAPPEAGPAQRHYQAARQAGVEPDPELESWFAAATLAPPDPAR